MPISALPNAGLPSVVDGKMHYDLTPEQLLEAQTRFITDYGVQVVGGCCGTNAEHIRLLAEHCKDLTPKPARARPPARRRLDLQLHPDRAGRLGPAHRRAHQRQRFQGVPRRHDRGRLGRHGQDAQGPDRRRRPRDRRLCRLRGTRRIGRHGRDRITVLDPVHRTADDRLHRGRGGRDGAAVPRGPGDPELGQPRGRRRPGHSLRPLPQPRQGVRGRRRVHLHRRGGPGPHAPSGSCGRRGRSTTSPSSATASSPATSSSTRWHSRSAPVWRNRAATASPRSRASS